MWTLLAVPCFIRNRGPSLLIRYFQQVYGYPCCHSCLVPEDWVQIILDLMIPHLLSFFQAITLIDLMAAFIVFFFCIRSFLTSRLLIMALRR
jgi:hypothetical protein